MAGVVAMASVIEDFDTQPCKKARKDGGSPIVKTITNYFSPLPKPAEKPFSPPRSNNIMDYFSKRPNLVSKEKSSSPEQPKESCQKNQSAEKQSTPEAVSKQPPQKRRKKTNVSRKLVEDKAVDEDCNFVVQDSPERNVSAPKSRKPSQKKQKRAEKCLVENECKTVEPTEEDCSIVQPEVEVISSSSPSSVILPKDKLKRNRKPAAKSKKDDEPVKQIEAELKEAASFLSDASMEVNVDENSELNSSTVISFEDFVRSHSQDDAEEVGDDEQCTAPSVQGIDEVEIKENEPLQPPVSNEASGEAPLQVPQRTLTIQAEVHKCKEPVGKVASIFNKRNVIGSPAEVASVGKPPSPTVKRRSNVVLLEEELELLVLESDSTCKCSESERKQFMAAFKQAGKVAKTQEKPKKPADKDAEESSARPPVDEQAPPVAQEDKVVKKKPGGKMKTKRKANGDSAAANQSPAEEAMAVKENKTGATESNDSAPATRRSLRGGAGSRTPIAPQMDGSAKPAAEEASLGTPVSISTPRKRKSRHGVFVAELVCPPDTKESPIRIRLTRVRRDSDKGENGVNGPLSSKNESEKQKQAKKLVEKAKAIKKSKKAVEVKSTLRRSSRSETSVTKTYCEDEDSIICLDDAPAAPAKGAVEKNKPKKSLRSLNDVLGKQASHGKGSKQTTASQEKNVRKVSIFDESSREGSENSQDDEQFKARREFLKSGLPENFRKQIAKAAATREAYSAHCLSFQPVLHATQPPTDCPLWSLPWPDCPLLSDLKEPWSQKISSALSCSGHFSVKTEAARKVSRGRVSGWRPDIAADVLQILIEEVRSCNSSFPVQMFLTRLKTKCLEYHQLCSSEAAAKVTSTDLSVKACGKGKRKRLDDDGVKAAKKQRAGLGDDSVSVEVEPSRRARRRRSAQKQSVAEKKEAASVSGEDSPSKEDASLENVVREDVLWTDKYQPQHSSDIVGNTASVRRLHSWLKEWKLRADREEKRQREPKKPEDSSVDSDWDGGDDSVFAEDGLCNTVLITGPTGVGKTAAVYACAQELGFKVFEVNASSQRSGRLILSQLREATQSHQVDSQGVNAHKPTYFTSYSTGSSTGSVKHGISPRKMNSPRRVVSSPRKLPQSPRGSKRGGLAPTSLAKFFKPGADSSKKEHQKSKSSTHEAPLKSKNTLKSPMSTTEEQSKKTATSLILFEEVDVIFEEDSGFLAAIKTFMATTKRPVILTTSDPAFSTMFDGHFEEIHFKTPSLVNVCSYLRLLCLTENLRTDASDVNALLRLNNCDVRQSLLQLQFWARSTGGRHDDHQLQAHKDGEAGTSGEVKDLPLCDTGCTESALGLINSQTDKSIWDLLKTRTQDVASWALLVEGLRRGFNLTYSNMESLVPLPQKELEPFTKKPQLSQREKPLPVPPPEPTSFLPFVESDDGSPVKLSHRMKKNKRTQRSADKGGLQSDSDSEDGFLSLSKPQPDLKEEMNKNLTVKSRALTAEERLISLPVSQGLQAIADFFDSMSFADSFTQGNLPALSVVKDGMTDEPRMDCDRSSCEEKERVLEVQAAVEALSFHKCRTSVTEARDQALKLDEELERTAMEELTLPVAPHRATFSFIAGDPCPAHLATHRRDVMDSLVCRGAFGAVDRRLVALDYLPTLRTICRSEQLKEQEKVKRRFLHYLDSIHLGVDRETLQHLAEDFPGSHTRLKPCR